MYAAPHASVAGGSLLAGAFMANVKCVPTSPASGGTNTSGTVTLQAKNLDPFRRTGAVEFKLDKVATFDSPSLQTSSNVTVQGWADTAASWASTAIINGVWFYRARATLVRVGAGPSVTGRPSPAVQFNQAGGAGIPRSLYLYLNKGINSVVPAVGTNGRSLYLVVNKGVRNYLDKPYARSLYTYVNRGYTNSVIARALYTYLTRRDGEVFPYLNHINPEEQYELGQVDLYGDGFGQYLDAFTPTAPTVTVSSTNGGNIADYVKDRTAAEWQSVDGAGAWVQFTWGTAKRIVAVVLEGSRLAYTSWGVPRFTFDDASVQDGTVPVPQPRGVAATEVPVGTDRVVYWLSTPKVSTSVRVSIAGGGSDTYRGFAEAWVIEEVVPAQAAETSRAVLNLGLPSEQTMGIVAWQNRSANWWPANGGVPPLPAATVTVPSGAVSGLVFVEEST